MKYIKPSERIKEILDHKMKEVGELKDYQEMSTHERAIVWPTVMIQCILEFLDEALVPRED